MRQRFINSRFFSIVRDRNIKTCGSVGIPITATRAMIVLRAHTHTLKVELRDSNRGFIYKTISKYMYALVAFMRASTQIRRTSIMRNNKIYTSIYPFSHWPDWSSQQV